MQVHGHLAALDLYRHFTHSPTRLSPPAPSPGAAPSAPTLKLTLLSWRRSESLPLLHYQSSLSAVSTFRRRCAESETDPSPMAEKWKYTALLVIDMQKDFVDFDGPMKVSGGKAIVHNVIDAVQVARERGILVIWVVREHDPLGRDVELFRRHLYPAGKVGPTSKGSVGAELVDGLVIKDGDYKLVKTRFSAFFATHLHSLLQGAGINSLVIAGVQTPNCIRQTVFDAVALDYQSVTVLLDATAAATPGIHLANISDMKNVGVATPTLQEWSETDA